MSSVEKNDVGVADTAICPTWHAHEQSSEEDEVWCGCSPGFGLKAAKLQKAPTPNNVKWMLMRPATRKGAYVCLRGFQERCGDDGGCELWCKSMGCDEYRYSDDEGLVAILILVIPLMRTLSMT